MEKGGIDRWALVEQALIHHHTLLLSVETLPLRYDTTITLYKSRAHWEGELYGAILQVQYANEEGMHLRYTINNRVLTDKVGIVRYTPDALISILTQHRERSTLWRTLEQEIGADIVSTDGSNMRLKPIRLPNFVDIGLRRYYDKERGSWLDHVPDFIDDTFSKVEKSYERPEGDIISLDAWRLRSEQPKK